MPWNKTPDEKVKLILKALEDVEKDYNQIAQEFEVSAWLVGEIARKNLDSELKKKRISSACRKSKLGNRNPMYGKVGSQHHNSTDKIVRLSGYKTIFAPEWWTGNKVKSGRIYEHHYIWAKETGNTAVPKGHVVHHIDGVIDNNHIDNLVLMTISDHIKLHWRQRKEQRLSRKGVESSTLEAHGNPLG